MLKLCIMRSIVLVLWTLPTVLTTCVFPSDDTKPKGLEERAIDSEVVLAAYTRTVFKQRNISSNSYSAEFLVFNIIKGDDRVADIYQKRKPSSLETALNRRLVNVSNFGDPSKCESDVNPGETYILLLDILANGELQARYDGAYGPAVVYTRDKETALEAIGSSPWGEWSPCSGSCGGGIQQRRRQCDGSDKCSNEEGQQRTCNMFPCTNILNILEVAGIHRSTLRPTGRPTAYKLLPSGSWRSEKEKIVFPRTFPWEFSLLVTVRVKKSSSGGFLLRVLHSESLQVGLYISDILTLVLSEKNNIRASFIKSLFDDHWHQLAFSVRRDTVSFYLNCEYSGKLPLSSKIRPFGGQPATVIVGSTGEHELDAFQGDIEQLTITGSPDAAEKQCNSTTQPLNIRGHAYTLRQEARSRPYSTSGTQNDQFPSRGDIVDDEDFDFNELGSGNSQDDDDDYIEDEIEENPKKLDKIPLKSESSDEEEFIEDDEVLKEMKLYLGKEKNIINKDDDDYVVDNYEKDDIDEDIDEQIQNEETKDSEKSKFDSEHADEEPDKDDDPVVEGSGTGSQIDLAWSEWSPCSSTCNWGRRSRTSYCMDNGVNLESCAEASSKRSETEACFVKLCPTPSTTVTIPTTTDFIITTPIPVYNTSVAVMKKKVCRVVCLNGGTCQPPYKCVCPHGAYGSLCQYVKQACRVNCRNGGTCYSPSTCICQKGYFGTECQYALCKPGCMNGGICIAPNKCRCKPGYVGNSCHKAVCQYGCKNGGECVAPNKCVCRSGFSGKDCSEPHCEPACQNGGECVKPYFCHCPPGTKGTFCEKFQCKPECQNGGICTGKGKCSCSRGYTGYNCEKAYCPGGCLNGGNCGKTGKCLCPIGFSGLHCEVKKPCKFVEIKEPYKRGYKQKVTTQAKVPCGAWGWKSCTKTKVHYEMVYKTFYKTSYECEGMRKDYPDYQKMKTA